MRDLRALSDAEFRSAIADFEQDDLERKRNLNLGTEGARADFAMLVAGLGNSGGGTIVVGPLEVWTGDEEQRFDPARLSAAAAGVLDPRPGLRVSRRLLSQQNFVLIIVAPPTGSPYVLRRPIGKYGAGLVPSRVGTETRVASNANELAQLFARWGPSLAEVSSGEDVRARYAGRSADLSLLPGETGTFAVFYLNVGKRAWRSGSADEVVLVPSRFEPSRGYISGALSGGAVARQVQALVEPGQIATFTFGVAVPAQGAGNAFHFLHPELGTREIGVDVQCVVYVPMTLSGQVTDALTGAPLDNVCITLGVPGEWCWTLTNVAGQFVVDLADIGAQPGTDWVLFFIRGGYETTRSPVVRLPGDARVMNIQMKRTVAGSGAPPAVPRPSKVLNQLPELR